MDGEDGGYPVKCRRAVSVASRSWPAKTVIIRSGFTPLWIAARTPGRILPAAHPHTEFTTTMSVPFWLIAFSTSAAVRASWIPALVNSWRIGAIIPSGYIACSLLFVCDYFIKRLKDQVIRECNSIPPVQQRDCSYQELLDFSLQITDFLSKKPDTETCPMLKRAVPSKFSAQCPAFCRKPDSGFLTIRKGR